MEAQVLHFVFELTRTGALLDTRQQEFGAIPLIQPFPNGIAGKRPCMVGYRLGLALRHGRLPSGFAPRYSAA